MRKMCQSSQYQRFCLLQLSKFVIRNKVFLRVFSLCLFLGASFVCEAQQSPVTVQLRSCRTEYRTHNSATAPGFSCTLELLPPPGFSMCESTLLTGTIRIKDATGAIRLADRGPIVITPDNRALTTFTCSTRPTGSKVEIEGELLVTVAKERTAHPPVPMSMVGLSVHRMGDSTIKVQPAPGNASWSNREGTKMRCANMKMTCSSGSTIRRVERVWKGINGELYTQPVEITPIGGNTFSMQMWDTNPTEFVRVVTIKAPQREKVRFRLDVSLGEVMPLRP